MADLCKWVFSKNDFIQDIFYGFLGRVRSFLGPTIFFLSLIVPKKSVSNAATWSSSVWQIASVVGPAVAGFSITLIRGSLVYVLRICLFYFCINQL
jgi:hypothetical protein